MRSVSLLLFAGSALAFPAVVLDGLTARAPKTAGCPFADAALHKRQAPLMYHSIRPGKKSTYPANMPLCLPRLGTSVALAPGLMRWQTMVISPTMEWFVFGPCNMSIKQPVHSLFQTPLAQAIEATNKVFGMGMDLGTALSVYSTIYDGNPLTLQWSIGGSPSGLVLPPLLSAPQGLSGSHNKYEGDASATRADAYMNNGDATSLNLTFFKQLYDLQPEGPGANFDYDVIIQHRVTRRQYSVSTNPHFFNGPFSGFIALPAAYSFITRFMSNHSSEHPEGVLDHEVLKSFYGVGGNSDSLTYQKGYERIPDNWYKRNIDYSIPLYTLDLLYAGLKHPEFLSIGGNTGKVNSFAGVNVGDITGGVYNSANLLEGNNLVCFAFQAAQQAMPDVLKRILGDLTAALGLWTAKITPILSGLGCPQLTKYDPTIFGTYPGSGGGAL
ncbi:aromatic peroxygenase [Ceratobasidium sp. AG-Ba]|nr:aromatic peroxygenase [Ceratobasidium sp. AG-Ba]